MIRSDEVLTRMESGKAYTAPVDGWFVSDALYQRTRRAVADKIQELK